ncbi:hypothetical protein F8M41_019461, partial [Gigaspora margarita]
DAALRAAAQAITDLAAALGQIDDWIVDNI